MTTFQLASGRTIQLVQLSITGTYAGFIEGTPEIASKYILDDLPKSIRKIVRWNTPLLIIPSKIHPLPDYLWIAEFTSSRGAKNTDSDYYSKLSVCWFSNKTAFNRKLNTVISAMVVDIDWDQHAKDYDMMDF